MRYAAARTFARKPAGAVHGRPAATANARASASATSASRSGERAQPAEDVEHEVVAGRQHREGGQARVGDRQRARPATRAGSRHTASAHHAAQAMCSEGIAASSLACEASGRVCQEPNACVDATTSAKPPSIRGGATG